MKKRLLALTLCMLMMFALVAACNNDTGTTSTGTTDTGTTDTGTGDAPVAASGGFSEAWAQYLTNYDGIADDIAALEQWIHEGIMWEIEQGIYAGDLTPGWGGVTLDPFSSHEDIPDSTDPPATFTMFIAGPGEVSPADNRIIKELERITNVKLEIEYLVGELDEKAGVMIASGDYPDYLAAGQARGNFLNAGAFANLDGMIQDYPNLWRHYGEYEKRVRDATLDDSIRILTIWGRRYYMNDGLDWQYSPSVDYNGPAFWIQKAVLEWDGYSYPTTLDQYFDLLARYYAEFPEIDGQPTLPFEIHSQDWRSFCLKNPSQHLIGGRNEGDVVVRMPGYQVEIYQNKDYARDYYEKLNEVYHQGLINPETFTRNYDQYLAVLSQGRVLGMFDQQWQFGQAEDALIAEGRIERTYVPLGLTWDKDEPYPYNNQTHAGPVGNNGGGISVSCSDPDRLLKFLDQVVSPEVQRMLYWGFKDVDYYVTEDGRYRRTPEQKANWDDRDWRIANTAHEIAQELPKIEGRLPCGNSASPGAQPEERAENDYQYNKDFYANYTRDGVTYTGRGDFLPLMEFPGYTEVWSLLSSMDSEAPERQTFDIITDFQNRYLPGIIMSDRD